MADGKPIEIAKCYITVIPSLQGSQGTITKELTGATIEASDKAGKESGAKFGESFSKNLKKAGVAIGAVLAGAGAAAVGASKSFIKAANDVSAMGDSIGDNAAKMGISTKAYQEWRAEYDADWRARVTADEYRSKRIRKRLHGPDGYRKNAPIAW